MDGILGWYFILILSLPSSYLFIVKLHLTVILIKTFCESDRMSLSSLLSPIDGGGREDVQRTSQKLPLLSNSLRGCNTFNTPRTSRIFKIRGHCFVETLNTEPNLPVKWSLLYTGVSVGRANLPYNGTSSRVWRRETPYELLWGKGRPWSM